MRQLFIIFAICVGNIHASDDSKFSEVKHVYESKEKKQESKAPFEDKAAEEFVKKNSRAFIRVFDSEYYKSIVAFENWADNVYATDTGRRKIDLDPQAAMRFKYYYRIRRNDVRYYARLSDKKNFYSSYDENRNWSYQDPNLVINNLQELEIGIKRYTEKSDLLLSDNSVKELTQLFSPEQRKFIVDLANPKRVSFVLSDDECALFKTLDTQAQKNLQSNYPLVFEPNKYHKIKRNLTEVCAWLKSKMCCCKKK